MPHLHVFVLALAHSVGDDADDGISALWIVVYLEVVVSTWPHHRGLRSMQ